MIRNRVFRFTYQDKALNKNHIEIKCPNWEEAVIAAIQYKRPEEKLLVIECIKEEVF